MRSLYKNENGAALIIGIMFMAILAMIGGAAVMMTTMDMQIEDSHKASEKAFYLAEAGAHEGRGRLRLYSIDPITDGHPDIPAWKAFIGTDVKAQKKGWDSTNSMHVKVPSQYDLDYTVKITHQVDEDGNILYWGDPDMDGNFERHIDPPNGDPNIYLIGSYGNAEGASKLVQMEVTRVPTVALKGAMYTAKGATLVGTVDVDGRDMCGGPDVPGIATPKPFVDATDPVDPPSAGSVTGSLGIDPDVSYSVALINVQAITDSLKKSADFSYPGGGTHTGDTTPGPGDGWGTPNLLTVPPECSSHNIVYYETGIRLSGTVEGCGILLVDGDLELSGAFNWYGTVVVGEKFMSTGGGPGGKNIVGALLTGDTADADFIGGTVNINYCSTATENPDKHPGTMVLSWEEVLLE